MLTPLRMGRRLHLQVGERLLLLLRNELKNCLMPCELHMFSFMMMFHLMLYNGESSQVRDVSTLGLYSTQNFMIEDFMKDLTGLKDLLDYCTLV
jgi:hypothetical protein